MHSIFSQHFLIYQSAHPIWHNTNGKTDSNIHHHTRQRNKTQTEDIPLGDSLITSIFPSSTSHKKSADHNGTRANSLGCYTPGNHSSAF